MTKAGEQRSPLRVVARCYLAFAVVVRTVEDACPYNGAVRFVFTFA